ncbi:PREDICTED: calmodulin-regulated spectrin-associated protein 1-B-like isoform X3 [Cyprinodon variegatus]|uniref:calmodulin-regulated spectrin-associated protein 1-B-like isoform X3 n=2 Tax=Cyprinodon variegatus TaxID=28743 RepID=UPI0007426FD0|nr:PREDICTED: calmodulin-regulated spectrin-associated protein 1-B-like isoform X3 [Cyprinodon variegatus]
MDVSAGRDSTWRRTARAEDEEDGGGAGGGGMEAQVVPLELYDCARSKIEANLRWLFAKAYGIDNIPTDLRDPFYTDQYEQEHIKPPIINLLLSGELYSRVCGLILPAEQAASLQSHQSVIKALSRKGIYVLETNNTPVSDRDLSSSPIKMNSHVHLIDALMMAYTAGMISTEKVVSSVKRFSNITASKELPYDLEDAMILWINKVNMKMKELTEKESKMKQHLMESPGHHKSPSKWYWKLVPVRYRRDHLSGRTLQHFPLLEDLLKDVSDGTALLVLIHFYCPDLIRLEDICLKEVPSIADSLYNIHLLKEFSVEYLNQCFYLNPEDLLYSPPLLKNNVMVFIAELFWWFENLKPDFVHPRDLQEVKDVRVLLQPRNSRSHVPISNVTKQSFLPTSNSADIFITNHSNEPSSNSPSSPSQSLPPPRRRQENAVERGPSGFASQDVRNRPNSTVQTDGQRQDSILAWPERRARPLSQPMPYAVHFAKEDNEDSISLARSISKDSLASNIMSMTPKHKLGSVLPHRLSGQSLLSHMRIEDEEEEFEEEELVAVIHPSNLSRRRIVSEMEQDELEAQIGPSFSRVSDGSHVARQDSSPFAHDHQAGGYYLEPLIPTVPKQAKEKGISVNKQEESGENHCRAVAAVKKNPTNIPNSSKRKFPVVDSVLTSPRPPVEGSVDAPQSPGFFLHLGAESEKHTHISAVTEAGQDSDSDIADLEEDDEEDDQTELEKTLRVNRLDKSNIDEFGNGEVESAKLREDLKVSEHEDKEDASGRSSPCPSTVSWASSCSASGSIGVKMTSFAERKLLKLGLREGYSSTSSSQKTTPDGSEIPPPWHVKDSNPMLGKNITAGSFVPSELLQLHMQLEEQRRSIEYQKKKMEALSAKQRLKLGKAAFLNIVKKGGGRSDTLPLPLKKPKESTGSTSTERRKAKPQSCKDDLCLDALKSQTEGRPINRDKSWNSLSQDNSPEPDFNECSHSIDLLNQAISSIQQQMMQLSLQQDFLMKQNVVSPPEHAQTDKSTDSGIDPNTPQTVSSTSDSKAFAAHFVDIGGSSSMPSRRPPKLTSSQRNKVERKQMKEKSKPALSKSNDPLQVITTSSRESNDEELETASAAEVQSVQRGATFRVHGSTEKGSAHSPGKLKSHNSQVMFKTSESASLEAEQEVDQAANYSKQNDCADESARIKSQLIEVDLSELKDTVEDAGADVLESSAEAEQKGVIGFFFKDDEKAEDEMAKRRAAFLLKQQRKAEEARLRKLQQEAESEIKRDEARRKAEEDRIRKEEEKARRELIKQEYLRRKQEALMEEQGLTKPRTRTKPRRNRPKSMHRGETSSLPKGSTTRDSLKVSMLIKNQSSGAACRGADLSFSHRGSTLSLVTDADSVISGGADSNRASSRNMDRDWESASIASSVISMEYSGPKLFKEPSSKSNKPIIINAIAHCCLAGKVNEVQKNVILEEMEKCESNHLFILFRDGGCQFRAIYTYSPDTEVIVKYTGTGPRTITAKMIDKLYKYNSDRKQFTVIPAKTVSVSVDALTIHNHLWQIRRPGSARRK